MDRLEWGDITSRRWLDHHHHLFPLYFFHPHILATIVRLMQKNQMLV
jgi:hypothetical protein